MDEKTIGIIGYGRLGKIVARYAQAFGMRVLVYDHHPENYKDHHGIEPADLPGLLRRSDIVLLLISWSKENENFMDGSKFSQMKPDSYFINTARGELVDESALLEVLSTGKLKGAALDVLWNDSSWPANIVGSNKLCTYAQKNSNLLITPHMGGYGKDSLQKPERSSQTNFYIY